MRVISFGIYSTQPEYPRHRNLLSGLRMNGVEVFECNYPVATSFQSRLKSVTSLHGRFIFGLKLIWSFINLTIRFLRMPPADLVIVGNPGYFHVFLARFLINLKNRKAVLVYDIFYSLYDTVVADRKLVGENTVTARFIRWIEIKSFKTADLCLIDTYAHGDYISKEFNVDPSKIHPVLAGSTFKPTAQTITPDNGPPENFRVLFIGTYIPLQGVEIILRAARELSSSPGIEITLVGKGQMRNEMESMAVSWDLKNVRFLDWVPADDLCSFIRSFHLSLGIFGETAKTGRVIPFKIFDSCSAGVPFITADSPAIHEVFTHEKNSYLIPGGDPAALALAIRTLESEPGLRVNLAEAAYRIALDQFSPEAAVRDFVKLLSNNKKA